MKKKAWIYSLFFALVICVLIGFTLFHKTNKLDTNTDILTPEIEIPAGGEKIEDQASDTTGDESLNENAGNDKDETNEYDSCNETTNTTDVSTEELSEEKVQEEYHDDNENNIVTPEL